MTAKCAHLLRGTCNDYVSLRCTVYEVDEEGAVKEDCGYVDRIFRATCDLWRVQLFAHQKFFYPHCKNPPPLPFGTTFVLPVNGKAKYVAHARATQVSASV